MLLQFQDVVQSLKSTSTRFNTVRRRNPSSPSHQQQPQFASRTSNFEDYSDNLSLHATDSTHNEVRNTSPSTLRTRIINFYRYFFNSNSTLYIRLQVRKYLFPTLTGFKKKSMFSKISSVLSAPVFFLLATTLPVVKENALFTNNPLQLNDDTAELLQDYDDNEDQQNDILMNSEEPTWLKWLTAVQLAGAPLLVSFVLVTQEILPAIIVLPIGITTGLLVSAAFWLTTSAARQPRLYWMMCFIGFGVAVVWIFLIANEVVSVLQAIGMAVGVSEAILGLTIFALVSLPFFLKKKREATDRKNRAIVWVILLPM